MRKTSYTGLYKMTKAEYLSAKYYALRYTYWRKEIQAAEQEQKKQNRQQARTEKKIKLIEQTALEADVEIYQYLLKAVTNENVTYNALRYKDGMPCGEKKFYRARQKFYWLLSQRI